MYIYISIYLSYYHLFILFSCTTTFLFVKREKFSLYPEPNNLCKLIFEMSDNFILCQPCSFYLYGDIHLFNRV